MLESFESSKCVDSYEDIISGRFCACGHRLKKHLLGICYALDFNGSVWSACRCNSPIQYPVKMKTYITLEDLLTALGKKETSNGVNINI